MIKVTTSCCALCQIARVNNYTPKADIEKQLERLSFEKENNQQVGYTTGNGQTAVFIIVSPGEDDLEKNLIELGFKDKHQFERRVGYPQLGDLKMYIKNL